MLVCICIFKNSGLVFSSTLYGQLGPKFQRWKPKFLANVLKNMVHGPKCFGASIEIFGPVYNTMLHQKSSDTHTHTCTASANTAFSHSDKSQKQTKTETSQQGSHRQKSPWPEVIRCYSKREDSPRNRSISVGTCKLQVHVGLHLYFQEFWFSFFVYSIWTAWTKMFRRKPKFFANVLKNMVPDLKVLVRELKYLDRCTILCTTGDRSLKKC